MSTQTEPTPAEHNEIRSNIGISTFDIIAIRKVIEEVLGDKKHSLTANFIRYASSKLYQNLRQHIPAPALVGTTIAVHGNAIDGQHGFAVVKVCDGQIILSSLQVQNCSADTYTNARVTLPEGVYEDLVTKLTNPFIELF